MEMTKERVIVNDRGIKNRLKTIKPFSAISEYIWNGFDAKADQVVIKWSSNELGTLDYLSIKDNGTGIPEHKLDLKFKPFLSSEKRNSTDLKHVNLVHGKNGLGRLTFFKFANKATWDTTYLNDDGLLYDFSIIINSDSLDNFSKIDSSLSNSKHSGTNVIFTNIIELSEFYIKNTLLPYIEKEFSWFLYLFRESEYSLKLG
ncbi:ATP-binding protein, partial [Salmonella enterica]|nr:ATP-binding protein [Salmonella enterica]